MPAATGLSRVKVVCSHSAMPASPVRWAVGRSQLRSSRWQPRTDHKGGRSMLAFGGLNSGIFKLLLVLHILSAIFGFGGVVLNGLYAAQSQKRPGPTGRAVLEANLA